MAKWSGKVGFAENVEADLDVWVEQIKECCYYGDILYDNKSSDHVNEINEGVQISSKISFIADPYAKQNFHKIKYATYMGTKWNVSTVEVQYPRLIMVLGGIWNGS